MKVTIERLLFPKKKYGDTIAFFDVSINGKRINNFRIIKHPTKRLLMRPSDYTEDITSEIKEQISLRLNESISAIKERQQAPMKKVREAPSQGSKEPIKPKKPKFYEGYWDSDPKKTAGKGDPKVEKTNWKVEVSKNYLFNRFSW